MSHWRDHAEKVIKRALAIVFRLKGATARLLRQEFVHLRRMPSLWTTSYFVSTAGNVAAETIERYIQAQSTRA